MLAITLVVLVGLGLAAGPGQSDLDRLIADASGEIAIAEVEFRFRNEKLYKQYMNLHDYINSKFLQITQDLAGDAVASPEMLEQFFVIARIWLQPRRSFADLRDMFRITLDCYDNIIDILTRPRPSGVQRSPGEIKFAKVRMGAVRRHVNQVLDATENDVKLVVVHNYNKSKGRMHFDISVLEDLAECYKTTYVLITYAMLENLFTLLEDKECDRQVRALRSVIQPPLEWWNIYCAFTGAVENLQERLNNRDQLPPSDIGLRALSEKAIRNVNRRLEQIYLYAETVSEIFDIAEDVAQRKFILPEQVSQTYEELWKLLSKSSESSLESNTSHEIGLQDKPKSFTGPSLFAFQAITSLNPWKTSPFDYANFEVEIPGH